MDKHSTGGVGDKTTPVIIPAACAWGAVCPKLKAAAGLGYGRNGGQAGGYTGIQMRSFKGRVCRSRKPDWSRISGQRRLLAPADKKICLRDITGTVEVPALIAASIMSKKTGFGADRLLLRYYGRQRSLQ